MKTKTLPFQESISLCKMFSYVIIFLLISLKTYAYKPFAYSPASSSYYVNDGVIDGTENWCLTAIGNDANPGTIGAPFLTITKAISVANPGDIIYVDAGTYVENVVVNKRLQIIGAISGDR